MTGSQSLQENSPAVKVDRHRFSVEDYARMGEAGILTAADRVELVAGEVREMSPIGPSHAGIVDLLAELLFARLAGAAQVRTQGPVRLSRDTELEPDVALLRRRDDYYRRRHPEAGEILLVIEVADSSLPYDRGEKMPRYARAGIPEAWLVDVTAREVTIYSVPEPDGYAGARVVRRGEQIVSATIAALRLPSTALFRHAY